jgi:hypothetical protein
MTPQESIERRMAALFVLALALIAWQAPRTRPLVPPWYVSALKPGEQVFPAAVPPGAPLHPPGDPAARLAFLKEHAVEGFAAFPADACEGFVRMSAHHWLRVPVLRERLAPALKGVYRLAHLAANADPFAPIAAAGLLPAGPGPEVEVFCRP